MIYNHRTDFRNYNRPFCFSYGQTLPTEKTQKLFASKIEIDNVNSKAWRPHRDSIYNSL